MGGYGFYVWGSYAVTFVLLAAEVLALRARKRRLAQAATRDALQNQNSNLEAVL